MRRLYNGCDYYQHTQLPRTKTNKATVVGCLNSLVTRIDSAMGDVRYSIGYGTLLGSLRHADFIPSEDDIDIVVHPDDWARVERDVLPSLGLTVKSDTPAPGQWHQVACNLSIPDAMDIVHADIIRADLVGTTAMWQDTTYFFSLPTVEHTVGTVKAKGPAVDLAVRFAEERYGKAWRTPQCVSTWHVWIVNVCVLVIAPSLVLLLRWWSNPSACGSILWYGIAAFVIWGVWYGLSVNVRHLTGPQS